MRDRVIAAFSRPEPRPAGDPLPDEWAMQEDLDHGRLISAAVLVPLIDHADGMSVLLTRRTDHLPDHAGQIAFPGGRRGRGDRTPEDTALRETEEEVGIRRKQVQIIGRLDVHETRTKYRVMPIIGVIDPPLSVVPEPAEVAHIFEVPLDFVLDPANHRVETYKGANTGRKYHAMPYGEHYIWGLTARILFQLATVLRKS